MSRSPAELGELRRRLRQERADHDGRDEGDGDDPGGRGRARRAALLGLVIVAIAAVVAVVSLPRIFFGSARDRAFDPSNPPEALVLCQDYVLTGPHASPGSDALVVDSVPGQPVRVPEGAGCPLVLEVRTPDGTFIQYVGAEASPSA